MPSISRIADVAALRERTRELPTDSELTRNIRALVRATGVTSADPLTIRSGEDDRYDLYRAQENLGGWLAKEIARAGGLDPSAMAALTAMSTYTPGGNAAIGSGARHTVDLMVAAPNQPVREWLVAQLDKGRVEIQDAKGLMAHLFKDGAMVEGAKEFLSKLKESPMLEKEAQLFLLPLLGSWVDLPTTTVEGKGPWFARPEAYDRRFVSIQDSAGRRAIRDATELSRAAGLGGLADSSAALGAFTDSSGTTYQDMPFPQADLLPFKWEPATFKAGVATAIEDVQGLLSNLPTIGSNAGRSPEYANAVVPDGLIEADSTDTPVALLQELREIRKLTSVLREDGDLVYDSTLSKAEVRQSLENALAKLQALEALQLPSP